VQSDLARKGEDLVRIRATIARRRCSLSPDPAMRICAAGRRAKGRGKLPVVTQDEPGDAMFVIASGRIKVVMFGEAAAR
jgi:hypothetical protein